jgi:hypothetical protein
MIARVSVKAIRTNAILMVALSSALWVLQGVTGNAELEVAVILLHEASGLGVRV